MKYRTVFNFNKMSFVKGKPKLFFAILLFSITTGSLSVPNASGAGGPTAHINWSGVSLSTTSGFSHSITPLADAINNSWTFFSPCGPGSTNLCFEMGILNNHNAWIRVESTDQYRSTGTANCHTRAPNIFQDANSKGLDCNLFMNDFAAGTKYDFSITPEGTGPGNWWTASYRNTKTGAWVPLVQFRFDLTASAALNMQNFTLTDQLNYGINDTVVADCNQVPLASAILGKPNNTNSSNQVIYTGIGYMNCAHYRIDDLQDGSGGKLLNFGGDGNYATTLIPAESSNTKNLQGDLVRQSSGGSPISVSCPIPGTYGVGIRVSGQLAPNFPFVQLLRILCQKVNPLPAIGTPGLSYPTSTFIDQPPGNVESSIHDAFCPQDSAVTGLGVSTRQYVTDVSLICTNISTGQVSATSTIGSGSGQQINASSKCPASNGKISFVKGFYGYGAAGIDGIGVICDVPSGIAIGVTPNSNLPASKNAPTGLSLSLLNGVIHVYVTLPTWSSGVSTGAYLISPKLSYDSSNKLDAVISNGIADFAIPAKASMSGTSIPVQIYATNSSGTSEPLDSTLKFPKITSVDTMPIPSKSTQTKTDSKKSKNGNTSVPVRPSDPKYNLTGNKVVLTVTAPSAIGAEPSGALLLASDLGFGKGREIKGKISGGKAIFEIILNSSMANKSANVSIFLTNDIGASAPLSAKVVMPPVIEDAVPQGTAKATSSTCTKGASKRTFSGSACPPGWKRS